MVKREGKNSLEGKRLRKNGLREKDKVKLVQEEKREGKTGLD